MTHIQILRADLPSLSEHYLSYFIMFYLFCSIYLYFTCILHFVFLFVGYGDIFPDTVPARVVTATIVLLGFSLIPAQVRS